MKVIKGKFERKAANDKILKRLKNRKDPLKRDVENAMYSPTYKKIEKIEGALEVLFSEKDESKGNRPD